MSLARGVPGAKHSIGKGRADARPDGPGGEPARSNLGAGKRVGHAFARPSDMPQHGVAGALFILAASVQSPSGDAARATDAALIAPHHPAISAGKDEERHQIGRKVGAVEMSFESEKVGLPVGRIAIRQPGAFLPRTVGRDERAR